VNPQTKFEYVLRLGDNALILGQRLAEWLGHAPVLEEDIASANISLDLIGQARLWLTYAGTLEGAGRDEDELAYHREQHQFRNFTMLELPNHDYAFTVVRRFLFDTWHCLALDALARSPDSDLAAIAAKSTKEAHYHRRHSGDWLVRLGDGTDESHARTQAGLDTLWRYSAEFFEADDVDTAMAASGEGFAPEGLRDHWTEEVGTMLREATLVMPGPAKFISRGKQGQHSEHLSHLLAEMQVLPRAHPDARW
jgi:ring-1,2-phenylacetyl-CoA epoxidase subunit PaaC